MLILPTHTKAKAWGVFEFECFDKNGRLKWKKEAYNAMVNTGRELWLDVMFYTTAKPTWYMGLIRSPNYTGLSASDTMASHSGWEEANEYSETTRQLVTFAAASGGAITHTERVYFSINASQTMKGAFLCTDSTKQGSTGTLFCTALFTGGDESVENGDVLKVTYTVNLAAA